MSSVIANSLAAPATATPQTDSAERTLRITPPHLTHSSIPTVPETSHTVFQGTVINAVNGYPVTGVTVKLAFVEPRGDGSMVAANTPLGQGTTDQNGVFLIRLIATTQVQERLCLLRNFPGTAVAWEVLLASGQSVPVTVVTRKVGPATEVTLNTRLPAVSISVAQWETVATRMMQAKVSQLNMLANELVLVAPAKSMFADWAVEQRHAAEQSLELEFLDGSGALRKLGPVPTFYQMATSTSLEAYQATLGSNPTVPIPQGAFNDYAARINSFNSLSDVDWFMDLKSLGNGQVSQSVNAFQWNYQVNTGSSGPLPVPQSTVDDLVNYRDYLRNIFTGVSVGQQPDFTTYEEQLENRFHQSFTIVDTTEVPANQLLIPIVESILTAAPGTTYGFGLAASAIPTQVAGQSDSAYVAQLVALSAISAVEFSLRYRLNVTQSDTATSNPVQLNIDTLQGFYRDGFQSSPDPAAIIPEALLGRAPFFLEYEEWLAIYGPFYGENYYQIRDSVDTNLNPDDLTYFQSRPNFSNPDGYALWLNRFLNMKGELDQGHQHLGLGEYAMATQHYMNAANVAEAALQTAVVSGGTPGADNFSFTIEKPNALAWTDVLAAVAPRLAQYHALPMKSPSDLDSAVSQQDWGIDDNFMDFLRIIFAFHTAAPTLQGEKGPQFTPDMSQEMADNHPKHFFSMLHAYLYVIPVCLGDVAMEAGNYSSAEYLYGLASGFTVGRSQSSEGPGYLTWSNNTAFPGDIHSFVTGGLYVEADGPLPYSCDVSATSQYLYRAAVDYPSQFFIDLASAIVLSKTNPMEEEFLRLRQGEAILEWADSLYRTNDVASIQRSRELYKAVLFIHSVPPGISPNWSSQLKKFWHHTVNPAIASQVARAQKAFYQIEAGLNYYGFTDAYVPALRYTALKAAADQFAASAKSAETDYLNALGQVENDIRQGLLTSNMLQKASLQADIAGEQVEQAAIAVKTAQNQVNQVNAAIQQDLQSAADADTFGTELENFFKGAVSAITSLPSSLLSGIGGGSAGTAAASSSSGLFGQGGFLGLGAAGAGMAGFGLGLYAATSGIMAAGNAASQFEADAQTLQQKTLPQALDALHVQQDQQVIANLQVQAAQADVDLARALTNFQANRTLGEEFWAKLMLVFKRALRRYLDLGAQYAWQAQQALAYELNQMLNVIRLDYFPAQQLGVSGADMLQLDLSNLEALRLAGFRTAVPIKHTVSLFSDFPLQYGQLKQTSSCTFHTLEQTLSQAYPGFYGFRIRAINVAIQTASAVGTLRGTLSNLGASWLSRADGSSNMSVRFADALPLSEFALQQDMSVFGLPDDSLMTFEGSGFESFWSLQFPALANPFGLDSLADILITFDLTANYSPSLYATQSSSPPTSVERFVLVSANGQNPKQVTGLTGSSPTATLKFDMTKVKLPKQESNRIIANLALVVVDAAGLTFNATFSSTNPALNASVKVTDNIAMSNKPPLVQSSMPPSPLNVFAGQPVLQTFQLAVDKTANSGVDFSQVVDVILAIDYTANLT